MYIFKLTESIDYFKFTSAGEKDVFFPDKKVPVKSMKSRPKHGPFGY